MKRKYKIKKSSHRDAIQLAKTLAEKKIFSRFDRSWFERRSVAIVGGADTALEEKNGEFIDSHDIVVRVNNNVRCISSQWDYIGTRTDFLFHSFYDVQAWDASPIETNLWKKHCVGRVVLGGNFFVEPIFLRNVRIFLSRTSGLYDFSMIPPEYAYNAKKITMPARPTTGFYALIALLSCNPRSLFVTGFSFARTSFNPNHRVGQDSSVRQLARKKIHDFDKEFEGFKNLVKRYNGKVYFDNFLSKYMA